MRRHIQIRSLCPVHITFVQVQKKTKKKTINNQKMIEEEQKKPILIPGVKAPLRGF